MSKIELSPPDRKMVDRWQMHTEFMLNRLDVTTLNRLVTDIADGVNYKVDEEGNIVEAEYSPIDRDKAELNERIHEKVENSRKLKDVIEDKISELKRKDKHSISADKGYEKKIEVLEEVLEEVNNV